MTSNLFPKCGTAENVLFEEMSRIREKDFDWRSGRMGLYVHYANEAVLAVSQRAHTAYFSENALGMSAFPSLRRFERDIVQWTASLLNGSSETEGSITSGGTESIFLAVKTARDHARAVRPQVVVPNMVIPVSAHPAFNKAAQYLNIEVKRVLLDRDFRVDTEAVRAAIDENTIMLVGSAPGLPHGLIDPIAELGGLAAAHNIWLHVDACVGGYIAPFARELGYQIPDFDFTVPGVNSISADLHKYGFSSKGASTVLFRDPDMRKYQIFDFDEWPRGHYVSPTFAGSRPAGPIASAWAVMRFLGWDGYIEIVRQIMTARDRLIAGINHIDGLRVLGEPHIAVFAYYATSIDIDAVAQAMESRGWLVNRLKSPPAIHFGQLTGLQIPVIDRYLADLYSAVSEVKTGRVVSSRAEVSYG